MIEIINKVKKKVLRKYPTFGSITANMEFVIDDSFYSNGIPTCATDGKKIYFHSKFIENATDEEMLFVMAHEIGHIAFNHIYRSEGKNLELWNIASDAVLNQELKSDGLKLLKGSIDREDAKGYNVEDYYNKLLEEYNNQNENGDSENQKDNDSSNNQSDDDFSDNKNENGDSGDKGDDDSLDNKNENGDSGDKGDDDSSDNQNNNGNSGDKGDDDSSDNQNENGNSENKGDDDSLNNQNDSGSSYKDQGHDTHSLWNKAIEDKNKENDGKSEESTEKKDESIDEVKGFEENKKKRNKEIEKLMDELGKNISSSGNNTSSDKLIVKNIGKSSMLIDWRYLLREAIQLDVDWSYRNAEVEYGVLTPQLETYSQPECEILLDTSGTISSDLLKRFLKECKNIISEAKIKVGCFDVEFYGWQEVRSIDDIETLEYKGGGGTDFDVAVNSFSRRVENKILFTDGLASMPDVSMDVIWVVFGGEEINPKGGRVIQIPDDRLYNLCNSRENIKSYQKKR